MSLRFFALPLLTFDVKIMFQNSWLHFFFDFRFSLLLSFFLSILLFLNNDHAISLRVDVLLNFDKVIVNWGRSSDGLFSLFVPLMWLWVSFVGCGPNSHGIYKWRVSAWFQVVRFIFSKESPFLVVEKLGWFNFLYFLNLACVVVNKQFSFLFVREWIKFLSFDYLFYFVIDSLLNFLLFLVN